jgi:hypothetical protein
MPAQDGYLYAPAAPVKAGNSVDTVTLYAPAAPVKAGNNIDTVTLYARASAVLTANSSVQIGTVPLGLNDGNVLKYRMRARDTSLSAYVYWTSLIVDSGGSGYSGPGPLIDIVVSNVITD